MPDEVYAKWTQDYEGFEALYDFESELHLHDAVGSIVPCGEYEGTIRITIEYIPQPEDLFEEKKS